MSRRTAAALLALIALYFLYSTRGGLSAFFTGDDGMNIVSLHGLWRISLGSLAVNSLLPFTTEYRPVGGLFYRLIWAAAGFNPLPFRIACFVLMLANLGLVYCVMSRIAKNRIAAVFGVLFFAYHPCLGDLYYSTGTVYDLLCLFFYCASLLAYFRGMRFIAVTLLFILALNSKEMALTLPMVLLLYEALLGGGLRPLWARRYAPLALALVIAAVSLISRIWGPHALTVNPLYRPTFRPTLIFNALGRYGAYLLDRVTPFSAMWVGLGFAALLIVGLILRDRVYLFALLFTVLTSIPVCLIPPRAGFVLYVPMIGWALLAGRLLQHTNPQRQWVLASVFIVVLGALVAVHASARETSTSQFEAQHQNTRSLFSQLRRMQPSFPPGSRILFSDDPYAPDDWILLFLTQLAYNDPIIWVDRRKKILGVGAASEDYPYDYTFLFRTGVLTAIREETVNLEFEPKRLKPGDTYKVTVPKLAGKIVDVSIVVTRGGKITYTGVVRGWCRFDSRGVAALLTPNSVELGTVRVKHIRPQGGKWMPAFGSVELAAN